MEGAFLMNNFVFENTTKVYFGRGCVAEYLAASLDGVGRNVLLAYGGGSIRSNGVYDEVRRILEAGGKNVTEFSGIMANPTYSKVLEGAKLARENNIDFILAVGGGSVMDCSKAVSMAAVSSADVWDTFWAQPGNVDFEPIPVGVIVTIVGTGSEVNGEGVITNETLHVKTGRDYPKCNPKFAMLDPEYTFSDPVRNTAAGGFDILTHIMEVYFSEPDEDNVSDDICEALMRSLIRNLPVAVADGRDYISRSNLMWDSTMAETRITKLGKKLDFEAHQIEHQLSAYTDCNHGEGLAVISPVYYRHIYSHGFEKFKRFAVNVWGIPAEGKTEDALAQSGIEALADFIRGLGLPTTLRALGVTDKALLKTVADSCNISDGSYKRMTHEEILEILIESF
jgi:alcohol dehydrogenase YqhD (iron-dependent ADH family)